MVVFIFARTQTLHVQLTFQNKKIVLFFHRNHFYVLLNSHPYLFLSLFLPSNVLYYFKNNAVLLNKTLFVDCTKMEQKSTERK